MAGDQRNLTVALQDIEGGMPRLASWLYRSVSGELGNSVLDAGAGIGTYTTFLVQDQRSVVALENDPLFVEELRRTFGDSPLVCVCQCDLADPDGLPAFPEVDSALCLNVLEHIEDDLQALQNMRERVRPGGKLVALVPAYPWLYNRMDHTLGHYRRYRKGTLLERLKASGWTIERSFYFNVFSIAGWFVAGSILRRSRPGRDLARVLDFMMPFLSFLERHLVRGKAGLSLVAVCRR
jgi:SAM-dependent methyltransferase